MRAQTRIRDATLVCVLAYAGLRPGEALALEWRHIRERTILVDALVRRSEGDEDRPDSDGPIVRSAAADLAEWQLACGRPTTYELATTGVRPCG